LVPTTFANAVGRAPLGNSLDGNQQLGRRRLRKRSPDSQRHISGGDAQDVTTVKRLDILHVKPEETRSPTSLSFEQIWRYADTRECISRLLYGACAGTGNIGISLLNKTRLQERRSVSGICSATFPMLRQTQPAKHGQNHQMPIKNTGAATFCRVECWPQSRTAPTSGPPRIEHSVTVAQAIAKNLRLSRSGALRGERDAPSCL